MNDENQEANNPANSSTNSNPGNNSNPANDIPFVPPTDRTNLNDQRDRDTKPFIPPITKKDSE